jgi:hypothetical protein
MVLLFSITQKERDSGNILSYNIVALLTIHSNLFENVTIFNNIFSKRLIKTLHELQHEIPPITEPLSRISTYLQGMSPP